MAVTQTSTQFVRMTAADDKLEGDHLISHLHWYNKGGTAGDDLKVTDGDGNVIWEEVHEGTNAYSPIFWVRNRVVDLTIDTIDAGTLTVVKGTMRRGY